VYSSKAPVIERWAALGFFVQNTDVYALQRSDLNGFLFADVGVEASGMTLSVLSALSRLGMDPWQEASRLAKLPRTTAIEGLARIIASMPGSLWPLADATPIATRLVALLPTGGSAPPVSAAATRPAGGQAMADRVKAFMQAGGRPSLTSGSMMPHTTKQWTIVVLLVVAVLVALTINLEGHHASFLDGAAKPAPSSVSATTLPKAPTQ
jgi:hypothetical protein